MPVNCCEQHILKFEVDNRFALSCLRCLYFSQALNAFLLCRNICLRHSKWSFLHITHISRNFSGITSYCPSTEWFLRIFMNTQRIFKQNKSFPQAIKYLWEWQFCTFISIHFFSSKNKNYSPQSIKRLETKFRWNIRTFRSWCYWLTETHNVLIFLFKKKLKTRNNDEKVRATEWS
jgi:hypothetical protein